MDKMFYTLQEVCEKLGKTEDEVREMVSSGQLQEFRDKEELVFRVEQINLLAGVDEESGDVIVDLSGASGFDGSGMDLSGGVESEIGLSNAGDGSAGTPVPTPSTPHAPGEPELGAASSELGLTGGSGIDLGDTGSAAGLSAFDTGADMAGGEDDAAETRVGDGVDDDLTLETVGSGSGLLDLTRESDDTSLGAELLEEVYTSDDDQFEIPANASGLFEASAPDDTAVAGASAPSTGRAMPSAAGSFMMQESYDGAGSGLGVGAAIGGIVALVVLLIILTVQVSGTTSALAITIAEGLWMWTGGLAGVAILAILAGMFIGRASE
ncbi:MAG: helix-turn-helix domain-containing protein [Planctomycetota bacterium]|nr:helix-turn-helix domain-containing protein [Planctomycetota bacterium]